MYNPEAKGCEALKESLRLTRAAPTNLQTNQPTAYASICQPGMLSITNSITNSNLASDLAREASLSHVIQVTVL
jgi:hypothetical protein